MEQAVSKACRDCGLVKPLTDFYPIRRVTGARPSRGGMGVECRSAIIILCGGGAITDVIFELGMTPKTALYAVGEARRLLRMRVECEPQEEVRKAA